VKYLGVKISMDGKDEEAYQWVENRLSQAIHALALALRKGISKARCRYYASLSCQRYSTEPSRPTGGSSDTGSLIASSHVGCACLWVNGKRTPRNLYSFPRYRGDWMP
jgi:hypothetical protein